MQTFLPLFFTRNYKAVIHIIFALFVVFTLFCNSGCTYPEADFAEAAGEGETVPRSWVINRLKLAIVWNFQQCPEHEHTAIYTLEGILTQEIRYSFYTKESAEVCTVMILSAPCMGSEIEDSFYKTRYYLYMLRTCGLKQVSF